MREATEAAQRGPSGGTYSVGGDRLINAIAVAAASKMTMRWCSLFHIFRFGGSFHESAGNHRTSSPALWFFEVQSWEVKNLRTVLALTF